MQSLCLLCVVILAQFCGHLEAAFFEVGDNNTASIAARTAYDIGDISVYWPNGTVPYRFADNFDDGDKDIIRAMFREFRSVCVNFQEMQVNDNWTSDYVSIIYDSEKSYHVTCPCSRSCEPPTASWLLNLIPPVLFRPNLGGGKSSLKILGQHSNVPRCYADTGRIGGQQYMAYSGRECFRFHVIRHQIMHTLGFSHEHQRPDRDCFILFKYKIDTNSGILQKNMKLSTVFPYDIHSLMHFGKLYIDQYKQVSGNPTDSWRGWPHPAANRLSELDQYEVAYIYCHKDGRPVGHVYNDDYSKEKWCNDHKKMCDDDRQIKEECGYTGPVPPSIG